MRMVNLFATEDFLVGGEQYVTFLAAGALVYLITETLILWILTHGPLEATPTAL